MARVGLLEDNSRIARLCITMLNLAGHEVTLYDHAEDCLNALFAVKAKKDAHGMYPSQESLRTSSLPMEVLILDLHLPDMNGLDFLHHLQSHPTTQSLPLIFCTAATDSEVRQALHIAPRACVVEKPFKLQALTSAIAEVLHLSDE